MSLTISLTAEQVEKRLSRIGIGCRFTEVERTALGTNLTSNIDGRIFSFPTPQDNSSLTLSQIKQIVGADPARQPCVFDHPWYGDEPFMYTPCPPGRHLLYMDILPESVDQPSDYARRLTPRGLD